MSTQARRRFAKKVRREYRKLGKAEQKFIRNEKYAQRGNRNLRAAGVTGGLLLVMLVLVAVLA